MGSVLGELSMHILLHYKAEIDYRHYLGPSWKSGIAMSTMAWIFAAYWGMSASYSKLLACWSTSRPFVPNSAGHPQKCDDLGRSINEILVTTFPS